MKACWGRGWEGILHQREIRITTEASTIPLKSLRAPPHRDAIISRNQQTKWMKKEDNLYDELMFGAKRRRKWAPIRLLPIAMLAMRIIFYSRCWFILQLFHSKTLSRMSWVDWRYELSSRQTLHIIHPSPSGCRTWEKEEGRIVSKKSITN